MRSHQKFKVQKTELIRVLAIFDRIGFSHGDFHGGNFYYDEEYGSISVIDLGQSQSSKNMNIWFNNWFDRVPKIFDDWDDDRVLEFLKRLDVVNGLFIYAQGVCVIKGFDRKLIYTYLSVIIEFHYGWKIEFVHKGRDYHECIVKAVAYSFNIN
jgi:hypothetical protein